MGFITINEFKQKSDNVCLIDVRTPSEFKKGHMKGSINIPLFDDDERAVVGTIYKQKSQKAAILKGLDFVGNKMSEIIKKVLRVNEHKMVYVQCWRGGRRSQSVSWLLDFYGINNSCIKGGYKAYRNWLLEEFSKRNFELLLLGGLTGSGKTNFLNAFKSTGAQVIDLERLANHKGSAFGALGEKNQISNEQFSNDLYEMFLSLDTNHPIWLESESKSIGKNIIPDTIWDKMLKASRVELQIPHTTRLMNLTSLYGEYQKDGLLEAFYKIKKRLGGKRFQDAINAVNDNDYTLAADIALTYYDSAYTKSRENSAHELLFNFEYDGKDHEKGIEILNNKMKILD